MIAWRSACEMLRAARQQWMTAEEMAARGHINVRTARKWAAQMHADGLLRMRNRPKVMSEDGNKPPGKLPREYQATTGWGGL